MIRKYKKIPVEVEAIQWTGQNKNEIEDFCGTSAYFEELMLTSYPPQHQTTLYIRTLEGQMRASVEDYIIKGVKGEFYPCKPDVFWKTYERAEDNELLF